MAKQAVNELFDVGEIAKQIQAVLAGVREVTQSLETLKKVSGDIKMAKDAATLTKAIETQNQAIAKTAALRAKQQQEEAKLALIMAKTVQVQNQSNQALSESERLVKVYEQAMAKLNGTLENEAEAAMQAKVANAEASRVLKEQAKIALGLVGAYDLLQAEFVDASKKAKDMGVAFGTTSSQFKAAAANALELNNKLKAIDAGVGNFQRNVGNYESGFRNFNLVLRETPNFAISAQTGIQALSNNLPMLFDEIEQASKRGMKAGEIMTTLGKSIFSLGGGVVFLTALFTALPKVISAMESSMDKLLGKFKSFKDVQDEAAVKTMKDRVELEALVHVAKDHNKSLTERNAAVRKINDILPDYIGNVTLEKDGTIKNTEAIVKYIGILFAKAKAQAYVSGIQKLYAKQLELESSSLQDNITWYDALWTTMKGGAGAKTAADLAVKATMNRAQSLADNKKELEVLKQRFQMELENGTAVMDMDKLVTESKVKAGKEIKEKYYDAIMDAQLTTLEQEVEILKSIRDTETNSYAVRISAGQKFYQATLALEALRLKDRLAAISFAEAEDVKAKGLSEKEKSDIHTNAEKERLKITNDSRTANVKAEMAYIATLDDLRKKMHDDEAKRQKDALNEKEKAEEDYIKAVEQKLQDRIYRNDEQLYRSLDMLNRDYLNGNFKTYEDFEKAKDLLTAQYAVKNTEAEIAATEELLRNSDMSYKKRAKYEMQLAKLKKDLLDGVIKFTQKTDKDSLKELLDGLKAADAMVKNISSAIGELNSIGYDRKKQALDDEKTLIERNSAAELKRIQDSTLSSQQQAEQVILLEAKKQAQLEANDQKRRKLETEHARFQRLNSVAGIISGTSVAVVSALGSQPFGPWNIALAATIGALGAAQLVKALSSPIPKYKMGTQHHKGGAAIVGDGGKAERVILPSGEQFDTPAKSTLMHLPKGTKVLPDAKALDRALMRTNIPNGKETDNSMVIAAWQTKEIIKGFAKNKPRVNTKVDVNLSRDLWNYKNIYE